MTKETTLYVSDNEVSISESLENFSSAQVAIVKSNIAKGTTNAELAFFLHTCQSVDLNPLMKEIWCYKDNKGNLLVFAGRDGFLAKAQRSPFYGGIRSSAIYENDEYEIDIPNGQIHHKITKKKSDRGAILYGYAIVFRKGGEATVEIADFATYNKGRAAWTSHPEEMIKKVSEAHALKKAFGVSGIQCEYDFDVNSGVAVPISSKKITHEQLEALYDKKGDNLAHEDQLNCQRILEEKEENSYNKMHKILNAL